MRGAGDDEGKEATPFAVFGHDVLFGDDEGAGCCDVCGTKVNVEGVEEETGYALSGSALYVWARGDETRRDEPPLCPSCAAALGLSALGRWEIEEEEG